MADEQEPLSQDDIEALLSGGAMGGGSPTDDNAAAPAANAPPAAAGTTPAASNKPADADDSDALAPEDIELLFNQAEQALASVDKETPPAPNATTFLLKDFASAPATTEAATIDLLRDVELNVSIELGRTHMHLEEVLKLQKGSVVPLDKLAGDPVDVYVNGRLVARGEVLVLNDNFCIRVAELLASEAIPA